MKGHFVKVLKKHEHRSKGTLTAERINTIELHIPLQSPQASKVRSIKKYFLC